MNIKCIIKGHEDENASIESVNGEEVKITLYDETNSVKQITCDGKELIKAVENAMNI